MILVYKSTFSGPSITKKDNNKYANLTLMVAIFLNGRRNIHVLISQFIIHVDNFFGV